MARGNRMALTAPRGVGVNTLGFRAWPAGHHAPQEVP
jgi:hypothetical protein